MSKNKQTSKTKIKKKSAKHDYHDVTGQKSAGILWPLGIVIRHSTKVYILPFPLPRVNNFKFPLQHHKYNITQHEELGFS